MIMGGWDDLAEHAPTITRPIGVAQPPQPSKGNINIDLSKVSQAVDTEALASGVPEGERDVMLFREACRLRAKNITEQEAWIIIRELAPHLVMLDYPREKLAKVLAFLNANDHFFLNLTMPSAKCTVDAAAGIEGSSIITTMARNGTEFGIKLSGLPGHWFTGPAGVVDGLYLPGYKAEDAARDIGDSVITETSGIGGFAMAAAPAIVKFVGGSPKDAVDVTLRMYEICQTENDAYQIPVLDFRGTPTGIDVRKVVETGILPAINTGIAHKNPGVGMVGAGLVKPPENAFREALVAFADKYAV